MAALGAIASILGTVVSAAGTIAAGKAQQQQAEFEAKQLERKGKEEQVAAQDDAQAKRREAMLLQSRVQAVGASSGFSATDPTTLNIIKGIEQYGGYQAGNLQYAGNRDRQGRELQASARRFEGQAARQAAGYSAAATLIGGIGGLSKFAGGFSGGGSSYRYGYN